MTKKASNQQQSSTRRALRSNRTTATVDPANHRDKDIAKTRKKHNMSLKFISDNDLIECIKIARQARNKNMRFSSFKT